jgi:hypothetical protein
MLSQSALETETKFSLPSRKRLIPRMGGLSQYQFQQEEAYCTVQTDTGLLTFRQQRTIPKAFQLQVLVHKQIGCRVG